MRRRVGEGEERRRWGGRREGGRREEERREKRERTGRRGRGQGRESKDKHICIVA